MAISLETLTELHSELGTDEMPIASYIDDGQFARDCDKIFRKVWLNVGRDADIPASGGYVVRDMKEWNSSIIVSRDKRGRLHAFHNICMHRGNRILWDERGSDTLFECKYHGWGYGADGSLLSVPEGEMFFSLDRARCRLRSVAVDCWNGFLFVHYEAEPAESLRDYLGPVATSLDPYPFDHYSVAYQYELALAANWRVLRDSQLEGYHAKHLHRRSLPKFLFNAAEPNIHLVDAADFGRHAMIGLFGNKTMQPTPAQLLASRYGTFVDNRGGGAGRVAANGLNRTGSPDWAFDLYFVYPNFHIIVMDDMYLTHNMIAKGQRASLWEARAYYSPASSGAEWFGREYGKCTIRDTWLEDGSTIENTQIGLDSGVIASQHLQAQEFAIRLAERENERMLSQ